MDGLVIPQTSRSGNARCVPLLLLIMIMLLILREIDAAPKDHEQDQEHEQELTEAMSPVR
jgi:hypothetical protein